MSEVVLQTRQISPPSQAAPHDKVNRNKAHEHQQLKQASEDFEAIFLETVLKSMRQSVMKSGFMDGGHAEDLYRSMLDSEYAKSMSGLDQTGLSRIIYQQLLKTGQAPPSANNLAREKNGLEAYQLQAKIHETK